LNKQEYLNKVRDLHWNLAYLGPDYTQPNPAFNVEDYVDPSMRNSRSLDSTNFSWYDAGTKRGFINDNQLSISGASDKFNYLISGGYTNQSGYIINDKFKRKTLRVNLESQATNWLKVGVQSFGSFVNQDGAEPDLGALFQMSPLQTPYNADGSYNAFPFNSVDPNPFLTYDISNRERHNYLFANVYGEVNVPFVKGLTYRVNFGNNYRTDQNYYASKYAGGQTGQAYKFNESYYDYTLDNILTYSRTFKKHNILATAVYGAGERKDESTQATGTGFTSLTLGYDNLALATTREITSDGYQEALNYYMGRLNYTFDGKYLLTATVRRDGFSAFAANHKWGTFPSVSLGWILTQEPFMKNLDFVNNLKLTAGYGIAGNQAQRYYSLDRLASQAAYVFGDGGTTVFGQNISTLSNPNLRWEKTKEWNIGLDFSVLNSRLSGRFDFYKRNTVDLLFPVNIPTVTGFGSINTNVGEVQNKGFEISLSSRNIDSKNFRWNTTFNFSRNLNKILELLGSGDLVASNLFIGQPISAIYGYTTDGIYQLNDQIPAGYFAGSYRIVDLSKNGTAGPEDRSILGSNDPAYRFSILNSLAYKGFTLTFLVNSIQGGDHGYLAGNSPSISRSDVSIRNGGIAGIQYWTPANPTSTYALFTQGAPTINPTIYYSRSFVRLQDINLSYNFGNYLKKMNIQNLSLFVSGKNLKTWTNWKGWDPETGGGLFAARPLLKGYSVGLNVTF
jgi:TonB-linked SusC/RagA family outer membrane protein